MFLMIKIVRKLGAGVAVVLATAVFIVVLLISYVDSFDNAVATETKDCIVVFGAAVAPGGKPSRALYDRSKTAAKIYKSGLSKCIILSGASSVYGAHEVDVMREIELSEGVNLEDLVFDFEANNTERTIENLDKDKTYIFVSNDFHLARINLLAKREGLKDFSLHASTYYHGRPKDEIYWTLREVVAVIYYFFVTM